MSVVLASMVMAPLHQRFAHQIASTLRGYFQPAGDPQQHHETIDVSDHKATIVFCGVDLKPQRLTVNPDESQQQEGGELWLSGSVDELEVVVQWCTGSATRLQNVSGTIRGVRLCVTGCRAARSGQADGTSVESCASGGERRTEPSDCFIHNFMQQIEGCLSVNIFDVEFVLRGRHEDCDQFVLQAETLQLGSIETNEAHQQRLSHRLSIGQLQAFIRAEERYVSQQTLLEPFSYTATVCRAASSRWNDLWHGWEGIGELHGSPLVVFANGAQLQRWVSVHEHLKRINAYFSTSIFECCGSSGLPTTCDLWNSKFDMPLPDIVFVLSDDIRLQLSASALTSTADECRFRWIWSGGININGRDVVRCADGASWCVDWGQSCSAAIECQTPVNLAREEEMHAGVDNASTTSSNTKDLVSFHWDEEFMIDLSRCLPDWALSMCSFVNAFFVQLQSHRTWALRMQGLTSLLITGTNGNWTRIAADNLCAQWQTGDSRFALQLQASGMQIGERCLGEAVIIIPCFAWNDGELSFGDKIVCKSVAAAGRLIQLLSQCAENSWRAWPALPSVHVESSDASLQRLKIQYVTVSVTELRHAVSVRGLQVFSPHVAHCEAISWECSSTEQSSFILSRVSLSEATGICIESFAAIRRDDDRNLPLLSACGTRLTFGNGKVNVQMESLKIGWDEYLMAPDTLLYSLAEKFEKARAFCIAMKLWRRQSMKVLLCLGSLHLDFPDNITLGALELPIAMTSSGSGSVSVAILDSVCMRLENEFGEWLDATVRRLSATSTSSDKSFSAAGLHFGPSSYGDVSIDVPLADSRSGLDSPFFLTVSGDVIINTESLISLKHAFELLRMTRFHPLSFAIPFVILRLNDSVLQLKAKNIAVTGGVIVACEHCRLSNSSGLSTLACSSIRASIEGGRLSNITLAVEAFHIDDLVFLSKPARNVCLRWSGSALYIEVPSVSIVVLGDNFTSNFFKALCGLKIDVNLSLTELRAVSALKSESESTMEANSVDLALKSTVGLHFRIKVGSLQNRWLRIVGPCVSGALDETSDFQVLSFDFQPELVMITAGLASLDIHKILRSGDASGNPVLKIPYARVRSFSARLAFDGKVVSCSSKLRTKPFCGDADTTFTDIAEHFKGTLVRELPSLYSNGLVFGERATDLTAKAAGRLFAGAAMSGAVSFSALGSVCGLVITDIVKRALTLGRTARGASTEEKFAWMDFPRGLLAALYMTMSNGRRLTHKGTEQTRYGDFVVHFRVGIRNGLNSYYEENKTRFGAAGGSVFGMAVGGLCYGCFGAFVGNYLGARVGSKLLCSKGDNGIIENSIARIDEAVEDDFEIINDFRGKLNNDISEDGWVFLELTSENGLTVNNQK